MNTAFAQEREITTAPVASLEEKNLETKRVVFFAGDAIPSGEKYEMPDIKGMGGIYLPHIQTIQSGDSPASQGMIPKCKFQSMQVAMSPEWEVMLPPGERKFYPKAFIRNTSGENGTTQETISGFLASDEEATRYGEFKQARQTDVVYNKILPGNEVRRVIERSHPHGVGGVVEISALAGASVEEIEEAQHYFFPNWDKIRQGEESLPVTIREIETHIRTRLADIPNQLWHSAKKAQYTSIGQDMIKSCTLFATSALQVIEKDDIVKQDAAKNGVTAPHSPISEHLLPQVETNRKGDLQQVQASSTAELVREMRADRNEAGELKRKELELREREIALREAEMRLQAQIAGASAPVIPTPSETVMPIVEAAPAETWNEPALTKPCGSIKKNGEVCKREIDIDDTACWQHGE